MRFSIKARVLTLALVPPLLLAAFLTLYNYSESSAIGARTVDQFTAQMERDRRHEVSNYLAIAFSSIQHLVNDESLGSLAERQAQAKQILRQLRFDDAGDAGYIFVYDQQGVNVAHGVNAALEGRNLYDFQDPNGVYLIRELIAAAKRGGDYVAYDWKAVDGSVGPKLGYADLLSEWGWVIGTGFWIEGLQQQVQTVETTVATAIDESFIRTLGMSFLVLLIVAAVALFVVRTINRPLSSALAAMDNIARGDGDLTKRLNDASEDELGDLGKAFNVFANQVATMVHNIRDSANAMTASTQQLHQVLQTSERGVTRQQEESEQVATAVNELAAASHEVARSANQAAQAAAQAEHLVSSAQQVLLRAMSGIRGLADEVTHANTVVEKLTSESDRIGSVLDVIRNIAEQTNLLALNAAIESARAGEAGRGFAVVADEVRTLASRTQQSTHEIEAMIDQVQAGTKQVTQVMQSIHDGSIASVEHATEVEHALADVLDAVNTINMQNAQIASAAEEQTSVSETINENMSTIVQIAAESAAGSRSAREHMQELADTAHNLEDTVKRYRVN